MGTRVEAIWHCPTGASEALALSVPVLTPCPPLRSGEGELRLSVEYRRRQGYISLASGLHVNGGLATGDKR
jgi:hypothetical protein